MRSTALVALLLTLVGVEASAQDAPPPTGAPQAGVAQQPLRPGDLIRLRIWREEDLSGEFTVDANGVVVLPRLGEYGVMNETPDHLAKRLVEDYRRYLLNPSIEVTVLRRVNILGAVTRPGVYTVDPTVTLADALALAGGVTPIGNGEQIQILRDGNTQTTGISLGSRIADLAVQSGDQIFVPERSVFRRNTALYTSLISAAVALTIAIFLK
jgi:protein involved in polysaccharide export with SLBB domain